MKKSGLGLVIPKTLRIGGVTFYQRGGQVIGRVSESREKRSNTLAQFIQRQKLRYTTARWTASQPCFFNFSIIVRTIFSVHSSLLSSTIIRLWTRFVGIGSCIIFVIIVKI